MPQPNRVVKVEQGVCWVAAQTSMVIEVDGRDCGCLWGVQKSGDTTGRCPVTALRFCRSGSV